MWYTIRSSLIYDTQGGLQLIYDEHGEHADLLSQDYFVVFTYLTIMIQNIRSYVRLILTNTMTPVP